MESTRSSLSHGIELRISAVPRYLSMARLVAGRAAEMAGMSKRNAQAVELAVNEALTNIIRHSYEGPCNEQIIIKFRRIEHDRQTGAALEVIICDFGQETNSEYIKSRDLDELRPGGLGVHIIHSTMDKVKYTRQSQGGMSLRMLKNI